MLRRPALVVSLGLALAPLLVAPLRAAQPQFWRLEGARDFLDGDTEGLSVESEGRMRLAPAARVLHVPDAPYAWCLAKDDKGTVYYGTGNDGRIFKVEGDKGAALYDANELEVHAMAVGPDDRLYAATSPDGKVYAIDRSGKAEPFFTPGDKYIWALAFDGKDLLVATGAEAKIHRVDPKGKGTVILTTNETHVVSLAVDGKGNVYAGSAPGGIVYRVDAAGKVTVLYDSPFREVKALVVEADGALVAAAVDGKDKDEAARPAPTPVPASPAPPTPEVTVTESFMLLPPIPAIPPSGARPAEARGPAKGGVLRILATGEVDTLWSSTDDAPHSLLATSEGVLVGTGNKGKLYLVRNDRTWTMVSAFPAEQVTALYQGPSGGVLLATSNPAKVYALGSGPAARGSFTSKVKDTDTVSNWGRLRFEATSPEGTEIQIQTRSGNTGTPDATWSDWSGVYKSGDGEAVTTPKARFIQVKAVLVGKGAVSPTLNSVSTAYLQKNLRPQVQTVTIHPAGEVFQKPLSVTGEVEILGLDPIEAAEAKPGAPPAKSMMPAATSYSRKLYQKGIQTVSWKADDPNGDSLVYDVYYRPLKDTRFRSLKKGLTDAVMAWDTTTVPNGRYVLKVVAVDSPANPSALALSGDKESAPFDIDNTPPTVSLLVAKRDPLRLQAVAKDDSSIIKKVEYSVDGGRWQEVYPVDGINDALEEAYEIAPAALAPPGPHVIVVRAMDLLGNVSTARVDVP